MLILDASEQHPLKPGRSSLEILLRQCGVVLDSARLDTLWRYHGFLRAGNARLNMSRLHNFETIVIKHYVDSLLVLNHAVLPSPLVDMGSGAGLPGIPLAIARPDIAFILAEPRAARAQFLDEVRATLGLANVRVHAGRVGPEFREPVAGVIARAVTSVEELLERVRFCLQPGGRVLLMKGPDCDAEIAAAQARHGTAFQLEADVRYTIPGTTHQRRLLEYRMNAPENPSSHRARHIASLSNATFQELEDLLTGRGIRRHGRALIAGAKIVEEIITQFHEHILTWITSPGGPPPPPALQSGTDWLTLADPLFERLDVHGTHAPLLLVKLPEIPEWSDSDPWPEGCTLFLPFQDPENIGAALRSAAAFGVARVVLLREAAHPFHPKATRAAGPAAFQVPLLRGPALAELKVSGATLFALARGGERIDAVTWPERYGLVAGVEGPGLPAQFDATTRLSIPIEAKVESLNAATSVAIALYEGRRRSGLNKPTT